MAGKERHVLYSTLLPSASATGADENRRIADLVDAILSRVFAAFSERATRLLSDFLAGSIDPRTAFDFEKSIAELVRELGRLIVEAVYNCLEPDDVRTMPSNVEFDGVPYTRILTKTPREVATIFGRIVLKRASYRPMHKSAEKAIFPLEVELGIASGVSAALAERIGFYQGEAGSTQPRTLVRLEHVHGVDMGVEKLREVVEHVSQEMAEVRHRVQVERLKGMVEEASEKAGSKEPVLCVGRDGVTLGIAAKGGTVFEVASVATLTVFDRESDRLGTVYLGRSPETCQKTLSAEMTKLLEETLFSGDRPLPRLCYVTDAGANETTYFEEVLEPMRDPRTGEPLTWIRVVDFYHASQRLTTMAEALFGVGREAQSWMRKMRSWLRRKENGVRRVLSSAAALRDRREMSASKRESFDLAYEYLRSRTQFMRYWEYEALGIPRGSGITEAACKTIVTQRLKLSGMRWSKEGARVIPNLRAMQISGVWESGYREVLKNYPRIEVPAYAKIGRTTAEIAA